MFENRVFDTVIDEVLSEASFSPNLVDLMSSLLKTHYAEQTLMVSDDYPAVVERLYGFDDKKMYSIVSLSFVDVYLFFLLPAVAMSHRTVVKELIDVIKNEGTLTNRELGEVVGLIHETKKALDEVLSSSTRTTRKATSNQVGEVVLPPMEEMRLFYECGRKVRYPSVEAAELELQQGNDIYLCSHCDEYHQGRTPTGMSVEQKVMEGRWRTIWRREHGV